MTPIDEPYCSECNKPDNGESVDFGIGHYECHGRVGNDVSIQLVSTCCEAAILLNGNEYEPDNPRDEYDPAEEH